MVQDMGRSRNVSIADKLILKYINWVQNNKLHVGIEMIDSIETEIISLTCCSTKFLTLNQYPLDY